MAPNVTSETLYFAHHNTDADILAAIAGWVNDRHGPLQGERVLRRVRERRQRRRRAHRRHGGPRRQDPRAGRRRRAHALRVDRRHRLVVPDRSRSTRTALATQVYPGLEWPSVSPWAVAVGGTDLTCDGNKPAKRFTETAWEFTGGGNSTSEPAGSYQHRRRTDELHVRRRTATRTSRSPARRPVCRSTPDVAAISGDVATGNGMLDHGRQRLRPAGRGHEPLLAALARHVDPHPGRARARARASASRTTRSTRRQGCAGPRLLRRHGRRQPAVSGEAGLRQRERLGHARGVAAHARPDRPPDADAQRQAGAGRRRRRRRRAARSSPMRPATTRTRSRARRSPRRERARSSTSSSGARSSRPTVRRCGRSSPSRTSRRRSRPAGGENDYNVVWTLDGTQYFTQLAVEPGGSRQAYDGQLVRVSLENRYQQCTSTRARSRRARTAPSRSTCRLRLRRASPPARRCCGRPRRRTSVRASSGPLEPVDSAGPTNDYLVGSVLIMKKLILIGLSGIAALAVAGATSSLRRAAAPMPTLRPFCTIGPIRCQSPLRTDIPIVAQADGGALGLGAADLRAAYKLASCCGDQRRQADGRARRRLRRPDDRVGPQHLPRVLRDPAVHDRERLLPEGQPGRRAGQLPASPTRTGTRRSRSTPRWSRRSARSATSCSSRRTRPTRRPSMSNPVQHSGSRRVGRHGREPRRDRGLEQLRQRRAGARPDVLGPLLQPSRASRSRASAGDSDYGTIWPAASPYVTAVGGTELVEDPTTRARLERVVSGAARSPASCRTRRRDQAAAARSGSRSRRGSTTPAARAARSPTSRRSRTTSRSTTARRRSAAGASSPGRASARRSSRASTRSRATRRR